MRKIKVNPLIEKEIINLYESGEGTNKIAKKLNLGRTTIRKYLIKNRRTIRLPRYYKSNMNKRN